MKTYTKQQLLSKAVKMGFNKKEAESSIKRNYNLYIIHHPDFNLTKATRYCVLFL